MKEKTYLAILFCIGCSLSCLRAQDIPRYGIYELIFEGSTYRLKDNPVRDIELLTTWRNQGQTIQVYGFYDGDGKGASEGNVFKVRFCPVSTGTWTLVHVQSNDRKLNRQHQGLKLTAVISDHPGFWKVDTNSPGNRWYTRSDGSHPYILGNTMYSFLSEYYAGKPTGGNIKDDITNNSKYFKKVRMGITGDRYPHPVSKPFLDEEGNATDDGNYAHRPNPEWFANRVDLAVKTAFENDVIADLILNGPDTEQSRSILKSGRNHSDATPFLRYIAARYGSYPNVWLCLSNEYDIKKPRFDYEEIAQHGKTLQRFLPYPTPVSVHGVRHWAQEVNTGIPWFDHVIVQAKSKSFTESADHIALNYALGGENQPVINDELAYEGAGDGWNEEDVLEACLGTFMGGGYASTGYKPEKKAGHYFSGNFKGSEHKAADNLSWLRKIIDTRISFWKMSPVSVAEVSKEDDFLISTRFLERLRLMAWDGNEYLIAGRDIKDAVQVRLPAGSWTVISYDVISMTEKRIASGATAAIRFDFNGSRAEMIHFRKE